MSQATTSTWKLLPSSAQRVISHCLVLLEEATFDRRDCVVDLEPKQSLPLLRTRWPQVTARLLNEVLSHVLVRWVEEIVGCPPLEGCIVDLVGPRRAQRRTAPSRGAHRRRESRAWLVATLPTAAGAQP